MNRIVFSLLVERRRGAYVEKSKPGPGSLHRFRKIAKIFAIAAILAPIDPAKTRK
jgi:hypothetical protein